MKFTRITVERTDGTIETVEKSGHIFSESDRAKFAAATLAAGRGEITRWDLMTRRAPSANSGRCPRWTREQGCPMHGEFCANGRN